MWYTLVVSLHIIGATVALISGFLALRFPNGTPRHHLIGKIYLGSWVIFAIFGVIIGSWHPGLSAFKVLNILGFISMAIAYSAVLLRKRIGRVWLRRHYSWMLTSLAFVCVATVNQVLQQLGLTYPFWVFILLALIPFPVNAWYGTQLDRRYGFAQS